MGDRPQTEVVVPILLFSLFYVKSFLSHYHSFSLVLKLRERVQRVQREAEKMERRDTTPLLLPSNQPINQPTNQPIRTLDRIPGILTVESCVSEIC